MLHRENNFNLLRLAFASLVIVSHASEIKYGNRQHELLTMWFGSISFGELAVDSFFILSGFLISMSWCNANSAFIFLLSRVFRIFPGFLAATLLCAFFVGPVFGSSDYYNEFIWQKFILSTLTLRSPSIPPVFEGTYFPVVNGSMWTISFEFLCYLGALGLGLLFRKSFSHNLAPRKISILVLVCLTTLLYIGGRQDIFSLGQLDRVVRLVMFFLQGCFFYYFLGTLRWSAGSGWLCLAVAIGSLHFPSLAEPMISIFWGYAIIYYAKFARPITIFSKLPDVSYGVYLYAWPINKVFYHYFPDKDVYVCMIATLLGSLIFGLFSWYAIERPALKLKSHILRKNDLAP